MNLRTLLLILFFVIVLPSSAVSKSPESQSEIHTSNDCITIDGRTYKISPDFNIPPGIDIDSPVKLNFDDDTHELLSIERLVEDYSTGNSLEYHFGIVNAISKPGIDLSYAEDPNDVISISQLMKESTVKANGYDNLFVLQSSRRLAQITALGLEAEALADMIRIARFDRYPLVIIDSGTVPCVVSMCISACDKLIIPMMMSLQCIGPTRNTINLARRKHAEILGLIPLTVGKSRWDRAILENWESVIRDSSELGWQLGLMEGIPQSRTIVRADLAGGKFPKIAVPVMERILETLEVRKAAE